MNTCYIPQIGVDDVIATNLGWKASQKEGQFNPMIIATLRGIYDDAHPNAPLNLENLTEATETLVKYRRQLSQVSAKSINSAGSNLANRYRLLKIALTAEERYNRVNMVASLFSTVIDDIQKANPTLSRKTIINGFTTNGNKILGEFAIFDKVYNYLMTRQSMHMHRGTEEDINKAHAYRNVLANWSTIVPFVRMKLRDTEGIKIGNVLEYCATANPDNYDGNKLSELYDASEAKREAWQETNDAQSAFVSSL